MARDRSLDEFFGDDADAESDAAESDADDTDTDADEGATGAESADAGTSDEDDAETPLSAAAESDVDPATPTYRWTPEGAACESCGRTVERRWEDDGAFVCDDCKGW